MFMLQIARASRLQELTIAFAIVLTCFLNSGLHAASVTNPGGPLDRLAEEPKPDVLSPEDERKIKAIMLIADEAMQAKSVERRKLLREFMKKSSEAVGDYP